MGAGQRLRRHVPPLLFLLALAADARRDRAAGGGGHAAVAAADDHPGDGRVGQHARHRRAAQPAGRRAGRGQGVRRRAAAQRARSASSSFAGTAAVVQPPTANREDIIAAIDRFQLQRGTAIGSGIVVSLATLFPDAGIDLRRADHGRERHARRRARRARRSRRRTFKPVPPGSYTSAAIILLTDGQRTTGPDPIEAAQDGGRPRRARLHRRHRHDGRRDHRLRRLVDARAPRRGDAEEHRQHHARANTSTPAPPTT